MTGCLKSPSTGQHVNIRIAVLTMDPELGDVYLEQSFSSWAVCACSAPCVPRVLQRALSLLQAFLIILGGAPFHANSAWTNYASIRKSTWKDHHKNNNFIHFCAWDLSETIPHAISYRIVMVSFIFVGSHASWGQNKLPQAMIMPGTGQSHHVKHFGLTPIMK